MSDGDEWIYKNPTLPGWYATLHSWDSDEGTFPGVHYWNGKEWRDATPPFGTSTTRPIYARSPVTFDDPKLAEDWADAHDPDI